MKGSIKEFLKVTAASVLSITMFSAVFIGMNNFAFAASTGKVDIIPPVTVTANTLTLSPAQRANYEKPDYTAVLVPLEDYEPAESLSETQKEYVRNLKEYAEEAMETSISMEEAAEIGVKAITELLGIDMNGHTVNMAFYFSEFHDSRSPYYTPEMASAGWHSWQCWVDFTGTYGNGEEWEGIFFDLRADTGEMLSLSLFLGKSRILIFDPNSTYFPFSSLSLDYVDNKDADRAFMEDYTRDPELLDLVELLRQGNNKYEDFVKDLIETNQLLPDIESITCEGIRVYMDTVSKHMEVDIENNMLTFFAESSNGERVKIRFTEEARIGTKTVDEITFESRLKYYDAMNGTIVDRDGNVIEK